MALSKEEQSMLNLLLKKQQKEGGYIAPKGNKLVHLIQVLDSSSSMNTGREITVSTYNECLAVAQNSEVETSCTLVTFSDEVSVKLCAEPVAQATRLNINNYVPRGMTALYDAIGKGIEVGLSLDRANDPNVSFLLQIFTDGEENSSKYLTARQVKSRIEEVQATGRWTVTVMGPNGNVDIYRNMGIAVGNIATFNASSLGSRTRAMNATVQANSAYFKSASRGIASSSTVYADVLGNKASVDDADNL